MKKLNSISKGGQLKKDIDYAQIGPHHILKREFKDHGGCVMEEKKWFILYKDKVQGPFTPSDLQGKFDQKQRDESRFWARGKPQWMSETQFKEELIREMEQAQKESLKQSERIWKIMDNDTELKPMTYENLLMFLKSKKNLANIKLWTEGYKEWQDVYQIEKILDEIGVNRRQHPRVPIKGKIHIEASNGSHWEAELSMISQGGFGIKNAHAVSIGEQIKATLTSQSLPMPVHCAAEVVFVNSSGFVGFRFMNISIESKSTIIAYVKQFIDSHPEESFIKMS